MQDLQARVRKCVRIVPEEYRLWKAVPQEVYLDRMMQYLQRKYYVSLLSAAERHGAPDGGPDVCPELLERLVARADVH